mgnify:CR=1 FL=1
MRGAAPHGAGGHRRGSRVAGRPVSRLPGSSGGHCPDHAVGLRRPRSPRDRAGSLRADRTRRAHSVHREPVPLLSADRPGDRRAAPGASGAARPGGQPAALQGAHGGAGHGAGPSPLHAPVAALHRAGPGPVRVSAVQERRGAGRGQAAREDADRRRSVADGRIGEPEPPVDGFRLRGQPDRRSDPAGRPAHGQAHPGTPAGRPHRPAAEPGGGAGRGGGPARRCGEALSPGAVARTDSAGRGRRPARPGDRGARDPGGGSRAACAPAGSSRSSPGAR